MEKIIVEYSINFKTTWFYSRYWFYVKMNNSRINYIKDINKNNNQNILLVYEKD